jgi:5,5'-dehydrodivanillate O-demethylase oxygenase subunit
MVSEARNELLTRVGPGTPMGELLRRYWHPVAAVSELEQHAVKPLRLLGEDLVMYRDRGGRYGLVQRRCPHRGADLANGFVEERGLRCSYHGWLFAEDGQCLARPFEDLAAPDRRLKDKVRITHYRVEEKAGMVWAYLGPQPAPLVPDWAPYTWPHGFRQVVFSDVPCNWLQCQENSVDPVHFEWAHENWTRRMRGRQDRGQAHLKLQFEEFEHGLVYKRLREGASEDDPHWTVGRVAVWPNGFYLGAHFEWRVPVDDENTLSVVWTFDRVPREREPYIQHRIPYWHAPIRDARTGELITSHVVNQDIATWVGQGRIADRTRETPGMSDHGIMLLRRRLLRDLDAIAEGRDPSGLIREPAKNRAIELPSARREAHVEGRSLEAMLADRFTRARLVDFPFLAGQPDAVREEFEDAMGITGLRARSGDLAGVAALIEDAGDLRPRKL